MAKIICAGKEVFTATGTRTIGLANEAPGDYVIIASCTSSTATVSYYISNKKSKSFMVTPAAACTFEYLVVSV